MGFSLIALLIVALYIRTLKYNYVIDDYVRREGYLWNVPTEGTDPAFFDKAPSWYYRLFMIGMHIVNTFIIYSLWGWQGALLFAVHPMSIWGTAWVTGNYYATTAYFTLISYFFLTQVPNLIGIPACLIFYYCALHSTVDAMTFPFLMLFSGNWIGTVTFIPLAIFMSTKRWKTGIGIRRDIVKGKAVEEISWSWRRPFFMTKVMSRYIMWFLFPMNVYFFASWGQKIREDKTQWDFYHSPNLEFYFALLVTSLTFGVGILINPFATLWFFILIGLHSQFTVLGQQIAQRYLYLPQIGLCVLLGNALSDYPAIIFTIAGFYICRTLQAVPQFKNQEALLSNEVKVNPQLASAHSSLAQFYISRKKLTYYQPWQINKIASLIRRADAIEPDNWVIKMNLTAFLVMVGKLDEAIEANKITIELMEAKATDRERRGDSIEGMRKQLAWLQNYRIDAIKKAKKLEKEQRKNKGKKK